MRKLNEIRIRGNNTRTIHLVCGFLLVVSFVSSPSRVEAVLASPHPFQHLQPDDTLTHPLHIHGDHVMNIITDNEGFTIIEDNATGWLHYATQNKTTGHLQKTELKVGRHDPVLGMKRGIIQNTMELPSLKAMTTEKSLCGKLCLTDTQFRDNFGNVTLLSEKAKKSSKTNVRRNTQRNFADDLTEMHLASHVIRNQRKMITKKEFTKGTMQNLVVLIRFSDHINRDLPSASDIGIIMNRRGGDRDLAPTGSVRDYFLQSSYGNLNVLSTVSPWIDLPETEMYYADRSSGATEKFEEALRYALDALDEVPDFSFGNFDNDGDLIVDSVMFLHSGYGAEWGSTDCFGAGKLDRIWAHKWSLDKGWVSQKTPFKVTFYHTSSALWATCGTEAARIGTISHELGHMLGLPDLYADGAGIGSYGVMGNSWGFDASQRYPPIMCPWSKIQLGWIEPKTIVETGLYYLEPSALSPKVYIINQNFPPDEYLIIENRQPLGFDAKLPQGGLAIWHIEEGVSFQNFGGHPGQANWPQNGKHYRVALLQADGSYDLERGENRGDNTDLWHYHSARSYLGPSIDFSGPFPNTDAYQQGSVTSTGHKIFEFSKSGNMMSFRIDLESGNKQELLSKEPTPNPTPSKKLATKTLFTTMEGENGGYGVMFDIVSTSSDTITIHSLFFHTRSRDPSLQVHVYTKVGSHENAGRDEWIQIADTRVEGRGFMAFTEIPERDFAAVEISPQETQAFYITLKSPDIRYSNAEADAFNQVFKYNGEMQVLVGSGLGKAYFESSFPSRVFNGEVRYSTDKKEKSSSQTIVTTFDDNNGSYGQMLTVKAFQSITISSLDIHTNLTTKLTVEIWTKEGKHTTFEGQEKVWTRHIMATDIIGQGLGKPTIIPNEIFPPIEMREGQERSFYIVLDTPSLRYTNGDLPFSNQHLKIDTGSGIVGRFGRSYYPRTWNGRIHYNLGTLHTDNLLPLDNTRSESQLVTTFQSGNGSFGCQFDILALSHISILNFDIHTRSNGLISVEVYSKEGSYVGYETDSQVWGEPIFRGNIYGQGAFSRTTIPQDSFDPVHIDQNQTRAFYITLNTPDLRYTNGESFGEVVAYDSNLKVFRGSGIATYKFRNPIINRVFNGVVHYLKR